MASNAGVRSPYFYGITYVGGKYFELNVTINGTLRYTLVKVVDNEAYFDVAELIRDYINITYTGTMPTDPADVNSGYSADVTLGYNVYTNTAGTGTPASFGGFTFNAFDGYSYFEDQDDDYNLPSTAALITSKTVWLPENTAGTFYYTSSTIVTKYDISTSQEGDITVGGDTVTIRRYPCSRYDAKKVVFINRYGMPQELWFFGKTIESSSFSSEKYKSANITPGGVYSKYEHQYKKIDAKGQTSYVLNTGFVSEGYNDSITELLMSEQVWLHTDSTVRPINITSSDVVYRTSLNDKLVQYTIEAEQANDLISTMR